MKVAPPKRHRETKNVARIFESYEEEKLKNKITKALRKKGVSHARADDDSIIHEEKELKDLFMRV